MAESESEGTPGAHPSQPAPCGLGRRLLVIGYDAVAVIALMMAVTAVTLFTPLGKQTALKDPLPTALFLIVWFLYLAWCWRHGGITLGMRAWRTQLLFEDGAVPGWGRCLLRFLVSLLSAAVAGLGYLWALFDPQRRTWHDLASRSVLIRTAKASNRPP
jgi:uncharacterized RDD family membrane protein YckC